MEKNEIVEIIQALWVVKILMQPGKMAEVMEEAKKYREDILTLQDIIWLGKGKIDKKRLFNILLHDDRRFCCQNRKRNLPTKQDGRKIYTAQRNKGKQIVID